MADKKREPDYGLDEPGLVRKSLLLGAAGVAFSLAFAFSQSWTGVFLGITLGAASLIPLARAVLMLYYAGWGKFDSRDRILARIPWTGTENVLDLGTGRGLVLVAVAKKLTTGRATGVDIWNYDALTGNIRRNALLNTELEGVQAKVDVHREDPKALQLPDDSFDVVLSTFFLHRLPNAHARERACHEIARVLKPGGVAVIADNKFTDDYVAAFARAGCALQGGGPERIHFYPPLRLFSIRKPAA
jgi:arsenite methyltransferase